MQILLPVLLYDVTRGCLRGQDMGQTNLTFNAEFLGDGRMTQIGVDKQNAFADFSDSRSNVCGNRGLAFARSAAGGRVLWCWVRGMRYSCGYGGIPQLPCCWPVQ